MRARGKQWISLLLTLCMALTMLPAISIPAVAAGEQFTDGQKINAQTINSNTTWNIPQGVTVSVQGQITISSGVTLTLTGGGTIQRDVAYTTGPLFNVSGTLSATNVVMDGQNITANNAAIFTENTGSIINLSNVTLKNFTSSIYRGGALRMDNGGTATLTGCTIQKNSATTYGGAIYAGDGVTLSITESTIKSNQTTHDTSPYGGGALYIRKAVVSLNNVTFSDNTSTRGGAIYNSSYGTLTITGGSIAGNTVTKSEYADSTGIFHSSQEANGSVLNLNENVQILDPIYLDGTESESEKVVILQSALQHPLTLYCANTTEGRVVIQGDTNCTVTAQDMARLSIKNDDWYFGLSDEDNQIFLTALESEAYIPITIESDDSSLDVTLDQNGQTVTLDYSETAGGYIGSVPAGTYDVYVGGADTGNNITVSTDNTVFDSSVLLAPHVHSIDSGMASTTFDPLSSLEATLGPGNYYLIKDLTNGIGGHITVSGDVILCLNGKTLNLNEHRIIVPTDASLTLCDCSDTGSGGSGKITGQDNTAVNVGLGSVYVSGGSFTMYSGSISDNKTYSGGGVDVNHGGRFVMYGGTISGNNATCGSGVNVSGGTFTMSGGSITGNKASGNGGGVFVSDGTFAMSGGSITGNETGNSGGGVFVSDGTFTLSGAPTITGNMKSSAANNVCLSQNCVITIGGQLTDGGKIGVTMKTPGVFTSGWNTIMGDAAPADYFTSENSGYLVARNSDGEAMLHQHSYTYIADGDTITESCDCGHIATATISIPAGADLTYTGNAITPAKVDYSTGWQGGNLRVDYADNTDAGAATASITKDGGTAQVTFTITARAYGDGTGFNIASIPDQIYTGSKIEPEDVTITFNGKTLTKGTDYTLSYGDNINAGTNAGSVIIEFKGNFSGKTTVYFDIVYADLPSGTDLDDYVTIPAPNENGWYKQDITLTPKAGVTIGTTDAATGGVTISTEGTDKQVVFIKDGDQTYKTEFEYQLDKTNPTVSDLTAETGGWTADDVIVSSTASDVPSGIDRVTVSKDGGTAQTVTGSGSDYSFPADSNGTYTVTVTDKAGNTTTKEITISNIDKTEPGLTVSGGDMGAASLTLEAQATPNGGSPVTVTAKDGSGNVLTANGDGSYTITEPGEYTFTATTDAGKTTTVTKTVYNITFDRNGGSSVDRQLVVSGGKVTKPADPTRIGYAFDSWMSGGNAWNFETGEVGSDLALTAAWTLNKPTVTLTADKGSATYNNGETVITLTAGASHAAGTMNYTYEWYKDGHKLNNVSGSTLTLSTVADTGSYTVKVTAEDSDALIAEKTSDAVAVAIQKATPVLTVSAAEITYGDSLSHSRLTGAASHNGKNVVGSFAWQSEATKPAVSDSGATEYTVVFTPGDQDNYTDATAAITLTVNRRELTPTVASVNDKVYDGNTFTTGTIALSGGVGEEMPTASGVFTFVNANAGENKRVNVTGITLEGSWGDNYALSVDHLENKASTGSIAKRPVELSWSKNSFTYDGTEKTVTATVTNAAVQTDTFVLKYTGNTQTAAGENYQAAVTALGNPNYTLTDGTKLTHDWTIGKKTITGTWQGLSQVYGDNTKVKLLLDGLVEGDEKVQAHITGGGSDAGRYELTATLDNYEITNDTAILVIEKKPVVISVTDNAVTPGGEPQVNVPDVPAEDYEVIYKDKDGNEADLSKPGNYEVWVKFPENSNYRHPNGSTEAPVGSVTVSETKPARYTVTFDGNGTTSDTMPDLKLAGGSVLTLPECSYAKTGAQFTGWQYGGKTYKPGDRFTMPYGDMTFTAQWQAVFEVSGTIKEETGSGEQNTGNAVVSLWLGANKIAETHTKADGTYRFEDLLPGIYNLVVTKDERTVTKKAIIEDENAEDCSAILPQHVTNSIVDVKPGSPDLVVGELDGAFTEDDISAAQSGGKVEITFKADERQEDEVGEETVKNLQSAGGSNLSLFLDCTLTKTVTTGSSTSETELSQSSVLLEMRLPLPAELQGKYGYTVSRMHGGEAQSLGTEANDLGEYFEVSDDKTVLTLHVCCFSTYAVGYRNAPSTPTYPPVKNESENGSITVSPSRPTAGQTVTITPKPDEGYEVDRVLVVDRNGQEEEVTPGADGTYRFTQPRGSVTITATFQKSISASDCPRDGSCPLAAFTDVDRNAWYHDGAHYCVGQGLMQGYGSLFGPDEALSRGMLVQILYNLENRPAVSGQSAFEDVADGAWYADAVNWAASQGIVKGYDNGNYGPDDPITREQLAAMLHRYARYKGYDVRVGEDSNILSYRDAEEISGYAIPAMQWACGEGLITGTPDAELVPAGTATRAQAAAILMRFVENVE